jgi:amino acid transporter
MVALLIAFVPALANAQEPFVRCGDSEDDRFNPLSCTFDDLLRVPIRIFNALLGFAAFILLGIIIFAGLRMLWYHLAESPEQELQNAKHTLTRGLVGFAIVAGAILIVNTLLFILGLSSGPIADRLFDFGLGPNSGLIFGQ